MNNKEEFESFIDRLPENAFKEFKDTEESRLLQERLDKMDTGCEAMLEKNKRDFAEECFGLLSEARGMQETYIYHKAFRDCVYVLKSLGVLA